MAPAAAVQLAVALLVVMAVVVKPVGALQIGAAVVNCACVYPLVPLLQFVLTLQSCKVEADKPDKLTEVAVVPVAALIHVAEALAL